MREAEDGRRKAEGGTSPQGAVNRIGSSCAIDGYAMSILLRNQEGSWREISPIDAAGLSGENVPS